MFDQNQIQEFKEVFLNNFFYVPKFFFRNLQKLMLAITYALLRLAYYAEMFNCYLYFEITSINTSN